MTRFINLMRMMLTWWHGQTLGTAVHTFMRGKEVGTDTQGNRYYQDKGGASINGKTRRWVIYNGEVEASRVPPAWHGWLHYTQDEVPQNAAPHAWSIPHRANPTGTKAAYMPVRADSKSGAPQGYRAWQPNGEHDAP